MNVELNNIKKLIYVQLLQKKRFMNIAFLVLVGYHALTSYKMFEHSYRSFLLSDASFGFAFFIVCVLILYNINAYSNENIIMYPGSKHTRFIGRIITDHIIAIAFMLISFLFNCITTFIMSFTIFKFEKSMLKNLAISYILSLLFAMILYALVLFINLIIYHFNVVVSICLFIITLHAMALNHFSFSTLVDNVSNLISDLNPIIIAIVLIVIEIIILSICYLSVFIPNTPKAHITQIKGGLSLYIAFWVYILIYSFSLDVISNIYFMRIK